MKKGKTVSNNGIIAEKKKKLAKARLYCNTLFRLERFALFSQRIKDFENKSRGKFIMKLDRACLTLICHYYVNNVKVIILTHL